MRRNSFADSPNGPRRPCARSCSRARRLGSARLPGRCRPSSREPSLETRSFPDGRLPAHWDGVKDALHELETRLSPDVVFCPRPDDAHQDHRLLGRLVPTVWRDALVLHYEIPKWDADLRPPTHYVPTAPDVARRKVALLDAHYASQRDRDWWDDELFLGLSASRCRGKSRYAEAFFAHKVVLDLG